MSPIYWSYNNHTSLETRPFGSAFLDLKQCCDCTRGLRYELRSMGIPVEDPTFIYCDNQPVAMNAILQDSTPKNKINSIVYHIFGEGGAKD